ncbi:MAG: hypothetical protein IID53_04950 [Proteobacteria bacterium]|nr:hypothetical protein [Pseudomonadota bacterium]
MQHPRLSPGARGNSETSLGSEVSEYNERLHVFQPDIRLGVERIVTTAGGTFAPDDVGVLAAVLGVDDRYGELVDLVAWRPGRSSPWWLRHGDDCPILGARALAMAAWHGEAVKLYASPEAWLRAQYHGDAVCILRRGIDLRPLFDGVSRVDCETIKLKQHLERQLRAFEPRLWVPAEGTRHAA